MTNYFVFAGEASGDLHGSRLIQALNEGNDTSSICGVGGPRMRREKFECFLPMEEFQVMGFSDVLCSLPKLWKLFYKVRDFILKTKPDCVILIDYPGFNLRLAQALRKQGYQGRLVQYICPSVWAHGKKRIDILANNYDLLLTIFPFEADCFAGKQLMVEYIGNPLVENIHTHSYHPNWIAHMELPANRDLIALFPGSRLGEIQKHVPQQLEIAAQIKSRYPNVHFALSCAQESLREPILNLLLQGPLRLNHDLHLISPQYHYDLMKHSKTALAKSGTVTLELAIHATPTVVHYEVSLLNYFIAKYILRLRLPHYCIVNILDNKTIFPEFFGRNLSTDNIMRKLEQLHFDSFQQQAARNACENLKRQLGNRPSHLNAAKAIQEIIR